MKAVILVGALDFGRCPIGSRLNRALWPVFGKSALQRLIDLLAGQGMRRFVICCQDDQIDQLQPLIQAPARADVRFLKDAFPRGPAGCIRDAADFVRDDLLVTLSASLVSPPNMEELCSAHRQSNAFLTVYLNPKNETASYRMESGIYVCSPETVRMIPECGYMDLKEGLVRELVRAGKPAQSHYLEVDAGNFRTWEEYIEAVGQHLMRHSQKQIPIDGYTFEPDSLLWLGPDVKISPKATIRGPAVIGKGAAIEEDVFLMGPSVIGNNVHVGKGSIVEESVLWDNAEVSPGGRVHGSLVDFATMVPSGKPISCRTLSKPLNGTARRLKIRIPVSARQASARGVYDNLSTDSLQHVRTSAFTLLCILLLLLIGTYYSTLQGLWSVWLRSDEYSSGLLVPIMGCYILWSRREKYLQADLTGPSFWGITGLAAAQAMRFFGFYYLYDSIERFSFVVSVGSLVLLMSGRAVFKKLLPVLLFLFLMLPLPKQVEMQVTVPLQRWATTSAVFCLETLGFNVRHDGNIIHIKDTAVAVAEACNGLRMLTAFLVVSGMVVLLIRRSRLEKGLILVSSVPIALVCNTARLTVTAVFFTFLDTAKWERIFHDFGGFAMMPVALAMIALELWIFSIVLVESEQAVSAVERYPFGGENPACK